MKPIYKLLFIAVIILAGCKPSPDKARNYYNDIITPLEDVLIKEDILIGIINSEMLKVSRDSLPVAINSNDTVQPKSSDELQLAFNNFSYQIKTSANKLEQLQEFSEDYPLKKPALDLLNEYAALCDKEYASLIGIVQKPAYEYSEEDDNDFLLLTEEIDKKLQQKIDHFIKATKDFAFFYNFDITKDSIASININ